MSDELAYVFFNKDTGNVIGISNIPDPAFDYIQVENSLVVPVLQGSEPITNYVVQYNPKIKSLEFASRFEYVLDAFLVKDFIYEIPEQELEDPDILIEQDIPNTCWKVQVGKEFKKNLKSKGASLNANLMFSITAKHDPNILYKTLFVDFNKAVTDNYYILPFSMPFETTDQPVSIYTARRFDTYQFRRTVHE